MFHFTSFASTPYIPHKAGLQVWITPLSRSWVAPFGNPGISACLTATPGISQPTTSFIACWCLDIHPAPLVA